MPDEFIERLEYDEYEPPTEAHTKRILAKQTSSTPRSWSKASSQVFLISPIV